MGWLSKLTGQDNLRAAGRLRMRAANVALNSPDYYQTTDRQMNYYNDLGRGSQAMLDAGYHQTMGDVGAQHRAALQRLDAIYGGGQQRLDTTYGQQRQDIQRGTTLNARALASLSGQGMGALQSKGGSLQARFAGAMGLQEQMGQQLMQNEAQGLQAGVQAGSNYMGLSSGLAESNAQQTGSLAGQRMGVDAQLGHAFANLGQQNAQAFAGMGMQSGQDAYGNLMQEAILHRQIEQEKFNVDAQNQMAKAQNRMGLISTGLNLGMAAFGGAGGLGGLFGGLGGAGAAGGASLSGALGSLGGGLGSLFGGGGFGQSMGGFISGLGGALGNLGMNNIGGWLGQQGAQMGAEPTWVSPTGQRYYGGRSRG